METKEAYRDLEAQYFGSQMHEQEEMSLFPRLLEGVQLFVDVGASLGPYTYAAGNTLSNAEIIAIEADPFRYKRLRELTGQWAAGSSNSISAVHAAVGDHLGFVRFYSTDKNISGGLFKHYVPDPKLRSEINWTETEVKMITLDELLGDRDPDLVKIDVEGAEYRVLKGASRILKRGKARFLVEVHPWGDEEVNKSPTDVFNLFAEHGYDFFREHRHWLFIKSGGAIKRFVKNRAIAVVMNSPKLKEVLKKLVLGIGVRRRPS